MASKLKDVLDNILLSQKNKKNTINTLAIYCGVLSEDKLENFVPVLQATEIFFSRNKNISPSKDFLIELKQLIKKGEC